jgi:hypothetical protein
MYRIEYLGWTADCESVEDLKDTYELNSARIAFSLGYTDTNNQFNRFSNTTVFSNEIIESKIVQYLFIFTHLFFYLWLRRKV